MTNPWIQCGCGAAFPCGKHWEAVSHATLLHIWDAHVGDPSASKPITDADKIEFARVVQKAERERCARMVERMSRVFHNSQVITDRCAAAIRELE